MVHLQRLACSRIFRAVCALFPLWLSGALIARAADTTTTVDSNFITYLAAHQETLSGFFQFNGADFAKSATPFLVSLAGRLIFLTILAGWIVDAGLGFGYSTVFAPAYAKISRACIFATGRVILSIVLSVPLGLSLLLGLKLGSAEIGLGVFGVCALIVILVESMWITYLYRTKLPIAAAFFILIAVMHALLGVLIAPVVRSQARQAVASYVDEAVTPRLRQEADVKKHAMEVAQKERDGLQAQVDGFRQRLAQAQTESKQIDQQIAELKNTEAALFADAMRARAGGDLQRAHDQLVALQGRFPNGARAADIQTQLTQVTADLAAQTAAQQKTVADAAAAAAAAQADLLARAAKGQVTLTELHNFLAGKTTQQVKAIFGPPSEIGPGRWGYGQHMVVNPMTGQIFGLAVYFDDGLVQTVDYYYGVGATGP